MPLLADNHTGFLNPLQSVLFYLVYASNHQKVQFIW